MSLLSFNTKDAQGPERAIVYRKTPNMRLGVIRLTNNKIVFRVDPDKLTALSSDPPVELTAEELKELTEGVAAAKP
jgi:hypothetical protein